MRTLTPQKLDKMAAMVERAAIKYKNRHMTYRVVAEPSKHSYYIRMIRTDINRLNLIASAIRRANLDRAADVMHDLDTIVRDAIPLTVYRWLDKYGTE